MTKLPYNLDFNDIQILKALNNANHKLGQLNGAINLLPNPYVIFNAITLGEAKESSEIENIVTTFDEIFKEMSFSKTNPASKEVLNYRQAMLRGYNLVKDNGFLNVTQKDLSHIKDFILFMIRGVEQMSEFTLNFINSFMKTMNDASALIKERCPKIYSQELVEHLFYDFYTKNEFLCEKLSVTRNTSSKYLHELTEAGILVEEKVGKTKLYKNAFLYNLIRLW